MIVRATSPASAYAPPWTAAEIERSPIPLAVLFAMFVAAWAQAEGCPVNLVPGGLELHCRFSPSPALESTFGGSSALVVASLGFAIPLKFDDAEHVHPFAAAWPSSWPSWAGN